MKINSIRIYAEVLEQGLDFKEYLYKSGLACPIHNIYTKKVHGEIIESDSLVTRIRKSKDVDVLITAISEEKEFPLLMVEYSTAVPTDDHKMQRSDVYYWGAVYKVPIMKIYPTDKGMGQNFGGGDKFNDHDEVLLAHKMGALFYPIQWNVITGRDVLETKPHALSCINQSNEIQKIINEIIKCFQNNTTLEAYYKKLLAQYKLTIANFNNKKARDLKTLITDSTRFKWENGKLVAKINRFGHAMDPDRGVLYFVNMLVGAENTITEIQINRSSTFDARGGYKSLFDAAPKAKEMADYVKELIHKQHNIFTPENALHILITVLGLPKTLIVEKSKGCYAIENEALYSFLVKHPSMTTKSIFFLSTKLILTDVNRKVICSIQWNNSPIEKYKETLYKTNYTPVDIEPLTNTSAKEDIITFASVELYKKLQYDLLAVSYPGAQGDRCILTGNGRNVLRTYIDIIAYKKNEKGGATVYLEECKDRIVKSYEDAEKLKNILDSQEKINGLKILYNKITGFTEIDSINIGIGAKAEPIQRILDVDYIFMFDIENSSENQTIIAYNIAIINTNLVKCFAPLMNSKGKLSGRLSLDKIYIIK